MATYILKRKYFDISAGGHAIPLTDVKSGWKNAVASGDFSGSFKDWRSQQLGTKGGFVTNAQGVIVEGGPKAGAIDMAYDKAAQNRSIARQSNQALASKNPPEFFKSNGGKELLNMQKPVQSKLDQAAISSTNGKVSNVSGGVQTRIKPTAPATPPPLPKNAPPALPKGAPTAGTAAGLRTPAATGMLGRWNNMSTAGKVGTAAAAAGGAYLLGKSLFGNKKKD